MIIGGHPNGVVAQMLHCDIEENEFEPQLS